MPSEVPLGALASEGDRAYVGYRWPGGVIVYRPSGMSQRFSAAATSAVLAEAVLRDRLGQEPSAQLVGRFSREWVRARARGQFVWPVVAVDEWLAAHAAGEAPPASATGPTRVLGRALETVLSALVRFRSAAQPRRSLSPQGGH